MMKLNKKHLACLLLVAAVFLFFVPTAWAGYQSFTVKAGQQVTQTLSLAVDDQVQIKFTVIGGTTNSLDFYITAPNGSIVENSGTTAGVNYGFTCSQAGNYTLHFSNVASSEDKLVSLECDVTSYIFGMPQNLFLVLIIIAVSVVAVVVFVSMSRYP